MRLLKVWGFAVVIALFVTACGELVSPEAAPTDITTLSHEAATIDFEGLAEGMIVDSVACGSGIDCLSPVAGSVAVSGDNPVFPGINTAMIFDATCDGAPANCTGGVYAPGSTNASNSPGNGLNDDDLFNPGLGNILTIAENLVDLNPADGLIDDPDDADVQTEAFNLDVSGWGSGTVSIGEMTVVMNVQDVGDDEVPGAEVILRDGDGGVIAILPIPSTVDGGQEEVVAAVNYAGVTSIGVNLEGSGAIDNIRIAPDHDDGGEGCTPGYWRQPHHYDSWTAYDPTDSFSSVFGRMIDIRGRELGRKGGKPGTLTDPALGESVMAIGGDLNAVARHGTAALLNAASPDVDYEFSVAEVIQLVQSVIDGGTSAQDALNQLVPANEAGCLLN